MHADAPVPPSPGLPGQPSRQPPQAFARSSILPLPRPSPSLGDPTAQSGTPTPTVRPFVPARLPLTVGSGLAEAVGQRWKSYRKELRNCQKQSSHDAVHELRVATRRLLAQFTLLGYVVPSAALEKARRVLKYRLATLGDLRDAQVQLGFLGQHAARFPEIELLSAWIERRERRLVRSTARKVSHFRTRKLGKWIAATSNDLAGHTTTSRARKQLTSAVLRATADAFAEAVRRRRAIDPADMGTIHRTRVAFKRFRYMMESLSPGITGLGKRQLRALAYYQRRMGIIQDLEVMQHSVASFVRERPKMAPALRPFCRYLRQRRARALRSFLTSADRLLEFWPPSRLAEPASSSLTRNVA